MAFYRMVKLWDIIIVGILIFLSFVPIAIFTYVQASYAGGDVYAVISSRGEVIEQVRLTGHEGEETLLVQDHYDHDHENVIEVNDGRIRIKAANCPDQICVRRGFISKPGQTIVCIPHQLVIELHSERGYDDEVIISS